MKTNFLTQKTVLIALATILSFGLASCKKNYANVTIPANERFLLGDYKDEAFNVKLTNHGSVEVEIKTIDTQTREQTSGFGLPAGSSQTINVDSGNTAVIENFNDVEALVKAELYEEVEGMRYEELEG